MAKNPQNLRKKMLSKYLASNAWAFKKFRKTSSKLEKWSWKCWQSKFHTILFPKTTFSFYSNVPKQWRDDVIGNSIRNEVNGSWGWHCTWKFDEIYTFCFFFVESN